MVAISPGIKRDRQRLSWQKATWDEYVQVRDHYQSAEDSRVKLFFNDGALLVDDMGWEGINHAMVRELLGYIFLLWFAQQKQPKATSLGGCLFEKDGQGAGSPDLIVYIGDEYPRWTEGETRKIDLNRWRVPDLVGEVSDTTFAIDLDSKKRLYASLGIAEYWVIDVKGSQVTFFRLDEEGCYRETSVSSALLGLADSLLETALWKLQDSTNMEVAAWFQQQLTQTKTTE